jgi:hypothetical protein
MNLTFTPTLDHWTPPDVPPLEVDLHCHHCTRKGAIRNVGRLTGAVHTCPGPWTEPLS